MLALGVVDTLEGALGRRAARLSPHCASWRGVEGMAEMPAAAAVVVVAVVVVVVVEDVVAQ